MCAPFDSISRLLCINAMQCIYLHHQKQESNKPIYQIEEKKTVEGTLIHVNTITYAHTILIIQSLSVFIICFYVFYGS